jgi:hypothetical protein
MDSLSAIAMQVEQRNSEQRKSATSHEPTHVFMSANAMKMPVKMHMSL